MGEIDFKTERLDEQAYLAEQKIHPTTSEQRIINILAQMAIEERLLRQDGNW